MLFQEQWDANGSPAPPLVKIDWERVLSTLDPSRNSADAGEAADPLPKNDNTPSQNRKGYSETDNTPFRKSEGVSGFSEAENGPDIPTPSRSHAGGRASMKTKESSNSLSSTLQREPSLGAESLTNGADGAAGEPMHASGAMAEMFRERSKFLVAGSPKQVREGVKRRVNAAVGLNAKDDWWVAGQVAEHVASGAIEDRILNGWINQIARRKRLPEDDPNRIGNPQTWLQAVARKLCSERQLKFGTAKKESVP